VCLSVSLWLFVCIGIVCCVLCYVCVSEREREREGGALIRGYVCVVWEGVCEMVCL